MIWNMAEPAIAILCACLPILRPFFALSGRTPTKHKRISSPIATVPSTAVKQQLQWNIIKGDDDSSPGIPSSAFLVAGRTPSTPEPMVIHVKSDWEMSSSTSEVHEVIPWGEQARTPPLPPTPKRRWKKKKKKKQRSEWMTEFGIFSKFCWLDEMLNWKSLLLPQQKWPVVNINTYVYVCIFYTDHIFLNHSVELNGTSVEYNGLADNNSTAYQVYMEQGGQNLK